MPVHVASTLETGESGEPATETPDDNPLHDVDGDGAFDIFDVQGPSNRLG